MINKDDDDKYSTAATMMRMQTEPLETTEMNEYIYID